eukprot:TRINITY_DN83120_c0_g1_i1.p1 TRINITY_DN83120_c0_g1~~TRINITY_DN83120_c0_g1_i1.p1  ORF type:complete len:593 (-),score=195.31 TRINITY_DN83120_c0_g1_i1:352-2130(-)
MADEQARPAGCPLQLIALDMEENKVDVNEDALGRLEKNLRSCGTSKVAVVSVMGAFRTGKSFVLDLFLRFLRYEENCRREGREPEQWFWKERGEDDDDDTTFKLPEWMTATGDKVDGTKDDDSSGFRFKGGMDRCTTGIWVWSQPFIRKVNGEDVALIIMDTQGAWDNEMTKEQSATIFGLTAVLSSKQIYNVNMQIQEDKVECLAYFMFVAESALKKGQSADNKEAAFQHLDFLIRDWRNYRDADSIAKCREMMNEHLAKHTDPDRLRQKDTATALRAMFQNLGCFGLPHPGRKIEKESWTGDVKDLERDFVRFVDIYIREVFTTNLKTKKILGTELTTLTFPYILKEFVAAFKDAAPCAMTFTQAITVSSSLLSREKAINLYRKRMDEEMKKSRPQGMEQSKFEETDKAIKEEVKGSFSGDSFFGTQDDKDDTWNTISENLQRLSEKYLEDNDRLREKVLAGFASIALLAAVLFILDYASDFLCDWWSSTCAAASRLALLVYGSIFIYIGFHTYKLWNARGYFAATACLTEMWKEMMRLLSVYSEMFSSLPFSDMKQLKPLFDLVMNGKVDEALKRLQEGASKKDEKKKQ